MAFIRILAGYLAAVVVTTVLGVVASTHFVLAGLTSVGAQIPLSERFAMTSHDIIHMSPLYGLLVGIGFAIAFVVAGLIALFLGWRRGPIFVLGFGFAGAATLFVILTLLEYQFDFQIIAGARFLPGYLAQIVCGALGGLVCGYIAQSRSSAA